MYLITLLEIQSLPLATKLHLPSLPKLPQLSLSTFCFYNGDYGWLKCGHAQYRLLDTMVSCVVSRALWAFKSFRPGQVGRDALDFNGLSQRW